MEDYDQEETQKKVSYEDDGDDENSFMEGYNEEDPLECEECGSAIRDKSLSRMVNNETYHFCSEACAEEFLESMG